MNNPATHFVQGTTRDGQRVYYTGAAGDAFVSPERARAFVGWYETGAVRVAARLNVCTAIHGITFEAAPADDPATYLEEVQALGFESVEAYEAHQLQVARLQASQDGLVREFFGVAQ